MAPGLQSIALYSQIVVDHARAAPSPTSTATNTSTSSQASRSEASDTAIPTTSNASRSSSIASPSAASRPRPAPDFSNLVGGLLPEGITHVQLFSGGAEAVEAAFRLAKSITKKVRVRRLLGRLPRQDGGRDRPARGRLSQSPGPLSRPACICALTPTAIAVRGSSNIPSCGLACAEHLRNVIKNDTQGEVAAIIVEPMQGTAGNVIPPDDFHSCRAGFADECGAHADRRRNPDRLRPHRNDVGVRPVRPRARHHDDRQGHRRRFSPERRRLVDSSRMSATPFGEPSGSSSSYGGNPLAAAAGLGCDRDHPRGQAGREFRPRRRRDARGAEAPHGQVPLHRRRARPRPDDRRRAGRRPQDQGRRWTRPSPAPCSTRRWSAASSRCPIRTSSASTRPWSSPRTRRCAGVDILDQSLRRHRAPLRPCSMRHGVLRGAFIGFGNVAAKGHPPGWLLRDDVEIVGRDRCRRRAPDAFRTRSQTADGMSSLDDLLSCERLDFVDICAPPGSHAAVTSGRSTRGSMFFAKSRWSRASTMRARWRRSRASAAASCIPSTTGSRRPSASRCRRSSPKARSAQSGRSAGGRCGPDPQPSPTRTASKTGASILSSRAAAFWSITVGTRSIASPAGPAALLPCPRGSKRASANDRSKTPPASS